MINRIEDKMLSRQTYIYPSGVMKLFNCDWSEAENIINGFLSRTKTLNAGIQLASSTTIKSLGAVEYIKGDLYAYNCHLEDLGRLKEMGGAIVIDGAKIESLGRLQKCTDIQIDNSPLKDTGKLEVVNGNLTFGYTELKELGDIKGVLGNVMLRHNKKLSTMSKLQYVQKNLTITECPIDKLELIEEIGGNLDIRGCDILGLGSLKKLDGFLIAKKSQMHLDETNLDLTLIPLGKLNGTYHMIPKNLYYMNIPKMDNLYDFGLVIEDDTKKNDQLTLDII